MMNKNKVLYIGPYLESSGWGVAARNYILAMDSVGIDVVPRAVRFNSPIPDLPSRLLELQNKSADGCDICIQHMLPHFFSYHGNFKKNIGLFVLESHGIKYTSWPKYINMMDEIWVPCKEMIDFKEENGIKVDMKLVPHAFDISVYKQQYKEIDFPEYRDFRFYFIGEYSKRKHLSALIRAFHNEFSNTEPVSLFIKTNKTGMNPQQLAQEIAGLTGKVKQNLRKYNDIELYKEERVLTTYMSDVDIYRLHNSCDCFVMPTYGDAWNIPCFDAMAFGKIPICTKTGGMKDYIIDEENGFLVDAQKEPVFGMNETFQDFGRGNERWYNINIEELQAYMRTAYCMSEQQKNDFKLAGIKQAENYSYEKIGNLIKGLLYESC